VKEPSHDHVLRAAAAGDDVALAELVRAYHDRVYRFGLRVCRDGFDADDAVQEAFSKLARRPEVARDQSVLSWLMTVVRNSCARMLRPFLREKRVLGERFADVDAVPTEGNDPEQTLERWRLVHAVHQAIACLDRASREVLVMRDLEGLSGEEACGALGLTEAAMKSRLNRARKDLRHLLAKAGAVPADSGWN
jgi:RNA polymerase sigma-70 factor (ECF subfamily)